MVTVQDRWIYIIRRRSLPVPPKEEKNKKQPESEAGVRQDRAEGPGMSRDNSLAVLTRQLRDNFVVRFPGLLERVDLRLETLACPAHIGLHAARHIHVAAAIALQPFGNAVHLVALQVRGRLCHAQ